MKKLLMVMAAALFMCATSFADTYLNFTIPGTLGWHSQESKAGGDDPSEFWANLSATGEIFTTVSNSFGVGVKAGYEWNRNNTSFDTGSKDYESDLRGWFVAPTIGWANDEGKTKKKINLYPFIWENITIDDIGNTDLEFDQTNYKFGVAFSFQWGQDAVQNGFEFGFDIDWLSVLEYDGKEVADDGTGFDLWIGYKLSIKPF